MDDGCTDDSHSRLQRRRCPGGRSWPGDEPIDARRDVPQESGRGGHPVKGPLLRRSPPDWRPVPGELGPLLGHDC